MERIRLVSRSADAWLLAMCVAVLVAAVVLAPGSGAVTVFGYEVPVLCLFRRLTGVGCPGCGLTRSFVFLAHGDVLAAWQMNPLGPIGFAWVVAQVPYRSFLLWKLGGQVAQPPVVGPANAAQEVAQDA